MPFELPQFDPIRLNSTEDDSGTREEKQEIREDKKIVDGRLLWAEVRGVDMPANILTSKSDLGWVNDNNFENLRERLSKFADQPARTGTIDVEGLPGIATKIKVAQEMYIVTALLRSNSPSAPKALGELLEKRPDLIFIQPEVSKNIAEQRESNDITHRGFAFELARQLRNRLDQVKADPISQSAKTAQELWILVHDVAHMPSDQGGALWASLTEVGDPDKDGEVVNLQAIFKDLEQKMVEMRLINLKQPKIEKDPNSEKQSLLGQEALSQLIIEQNLVDTGDAAPSTSVTESVSARESTDEDDLPSWLRERKAQPNKPGGENDFSNWDPKNWEEDHPAAHAEAQEEVKMPEIDWNGNQMRQEIESIFKKNTHRTEKGDKQVALLSSKLFQKDNLENLLTKFIPSLQNFLVNKYPKDEFNDTATIDMASYITNKKVSLPYLENTEFKVTNATHEFFGFSGTTPEEKGKYAMQWFAANPELFPVVDTLIRKWMSDKTPSEPGQLDAVVAQMKKAGT